MCSKNKSHANINNNHRKFRYSKKLQKSYEGMFLYDLMKVQKNNSKISAGILKKIL